MDSFDYIRRAYGVHAHKGMVVEVRGKPATITGTSNAHVRIRIQGEKHSHPYHPTDPAIAYPPKPAKVDGLGNTIVPDAEYYVQDARGYVGNCVSWWRPRSAGYACDIDDAGKYLGRDVMDWRETDVPWPVDVVERNARRYVDFQKLQHERDVEGVRRAR